jgi:rubrerythrin
MSERITLEVVDVDGAIQSAHEGLGGDTRADFFKKAAIGGGSLLAGGVLMGGLPALAGAATASPRNDVKILNYALTLEYLESAFYTQALANNVLTGDVLATAKIVSGHEDTHVAALRKALGKAAVKKPTFDFKDTVTDPAKFLQTSIVLEDTGVSAYAGQAPHLFSKKVLAVAASILTVEARHASRFRSLIGQNFAPAAFDKPASMKKVLAAVKSTGFITG